MARLSGFYYDGTADENGYRDFIRDLDGMDEYALSDNDEYELRELELSGILDGCDYDDSCDDDSSDFFGGRCVGFDDYGL